MASTPSLVALVIALVAEGAAVSTSSRLSETIWVAVLGLIGLAITAAATVVNSILSLRISRKSDKIAQQGAAIEANTNSFNSKLESSLRDEQTRNELLERLLASNALAAAAQATAVDKATAAALSEPAKDPKPPDPKPPDPKPPGPKPPGPKPPDPKPAPTKPGSKPGKKIRRQR